MVGRPAESTRPHGFATSETQFVVFILNASLRPFSNRFFTSSFRPAFYSTLGLNWVKKKQSVRIDNQSRPLIPRNRGSFVKKEEVLVTRRIVSRLNGVLGPLSFPRGSMKLLASDTARRPDSGRDEFSLVSSLLCNPLVMRSACFESSGAVSHVLEGERY